MYKIKSLFFSLIILVGCGGGGGSSAPDIPPSAPIINSNGFSADENQTSIGVIQVTDANGDQISISISGDDANEINLESSTKTISFINPPNFEEKDIYSITITASDGSLSSSKNINISINDISEGWVLFQKIEGTNDEGLFGYSALDFSDDNNNDGLDHTGKVIITGSPYADFDQLNITDQGELELFQYIDDYGFDYAFNWGSVLCEMPRNNSRNGGAQTISAKNSNNLNIFINMQYCSASVEDVNHIYYPKPYKLITIHEFDTSSENTNDYVYFTIPFSSSCYSYSFDTYGNNLIDISRDGSTFALGDYCTNSVTVLRYDETTSWGGLGEQITIPQEYGRNTGVGLNIELSDDGNRLVLGAETSYGDFCGSSCEKESHGAIYAFEFDGTNWQQLGSKILGDEVRDGFGADIAINSDGTIIAGSSPQHNITQNEWEYGGHVKVYSFENGDWKQMGQSIDSPKINAFFGHSIDLNASGDEIVIGAPNEDDKGAVYLYSYDGNQWVLKEPYVQLTGVPGAQPCTGTNCLGQFGTEVKMSGDGKLLIVSDPREDTCSYDCGAIYIYEWH